MYLNIPLPVTGKSNVYGLGPALQNLSVVRLEAECELFTADAMGRAISLKSNYMNPGSAPPFTFYFQHLDR